MFLNYIDRRTFYEKSHNNSEKDLADYIGPILVGKPFGYVFAARKVAQKLINNSTWIKINNGTERAKVMTIYAPLEGEATVLYEWTTYPNAKIYNAYKILKVKYSVIL